MYNSEKENQVQARIDCVALLSPTLKSNLSSQSHLSLSTHIKSEPEHPAEELVYEPLDSNVTSKMLLTSRKNHWRDLS
ncbi:MAG: hypothetical protein EAX87_01290 [Candidatus Thorarchaeota archaeon]|nr:hypothetical protein [Candidatus Thorarchaeota archaeon]